MFISKAYNMLLMDQQHCTRVITDLEQCDNIMTVTCLMLGYLYLGGRCNKTWQLTTSKVVKVVKPYEILGDDS